MYSAMLRGLQQRTLAYDRGFAHFVCEYQIEFLDFKLGFWF